MFADVVDLREFYGTRLGQVARRMVGRRIRLIWPDLTGSRLLGLGYATPYLRPFLGEAERVMALMPAAQGVLHWPSEGPNRVILGDEGELPLPDFSIDRVLLIHGLEFSEQVRPLLKEIWRVLAGAACSRSCRTGAGSGRGSTARPSDKAIPTRRASSRGFCAKRISRPSVAPPRF